MTSQPLIPLGDTGWSVSTIMMLRTAGMPAHRILDFSGERPGVFLPPGELASAAERLTRDPWFLEAMLWRNPKVVHEWISGYSATAQTGKRNRTPYRHMALAQYAQRFAMKNDTIGFFGPVAWARFDPDSPDVVAEVGAGKEVHRHSHFEPWAIESLARLWEEELRPVLPPWPNPSCRLGDTVLLFPSELTVRLTDDEAKVLRRCDGRTPPDLLGQELALPAEQLLEILRRLMEIGAIGWGFRLPLDERMDEQLADQLAALPTARPHLHKLRELQARKREVDRSTGDVERLGNALLDLNRHYETLSGHTATLDKQHARDGRTLLWMDSLTDWDVVLGAPALETIRTPLSLMFDACRWVTWHIARDIHATIVDLLTETTTGTLPLDIVFDELRPELTASVSPAVQRATRALQSAVAELVDLRHGGPVRLDSTTLSGPWRRAFGGVPSGWDSGRVHSADLMLLGNDRWVLGELHMAVNPLDSRMCTLNQRDYVRLDELVDATTATPRYLPAFQNTWSGLTPRCYPAHGVHLPHKDRLWTSWPNDVFPPGTSRLRALDLEVRLEGDTLVAVGDGVRAPLLDLFGEFLSIASADAFRPFAPAPHQPRVYLDGVVIKRESRRMPARDLLHDTSQRVDERLLATKLSAAGVPRHFFYRLPGEPKPLFCDLSSQPLLKNLLRLLRRAPDTDLVAEEMLPGFSDLWLSSEAGLHTAEFRLIATSDH